MVLRTQDRDLKSDAREHACSCADIRAFLAILHLIECQLDNGDGSHSELGPTSGLKSFWS